MEISPTIRYAGGNYTAEYRDADKILEEVEGLIPDDVYRDLERVFKQGTPTKLQAEISQREWQAYKDYGNHSSVTKNIKKVFETVNKEERNQFIMPFPRWLDEFIIDTKPTPMGLVIREGKKDRIIFDASFRPLPWCRALNDITHKSNEPKLVFGTSWKRHLIRIYNLRISYPTKELHLWDDDAKSAFRHGKHHPDIASAFMFILLEYLYICVAQTFGSNTSPSNWEPIARARAALAEHLFNDASLLEKHKELLDKVIFSDPPDKNTTFAQAVADAFNKGVFDEQGEPVKTPHNMFVDDNLICDILSRIKQAMAASIEALYRILGFPDEEARQLCLSMDKFLESKCSWLRVQLGILVNTRQMTCSLPAEKRARLLKILRGWHHGRKSFTALEAAKLVGSLMHACQVCPWGVFLLIPLVDSLKRALRRNKERIARKQNFDKLLSDPGWMAG